MRKIRTDRGSIERSRLIAVSFPERSEGWILMKRSDEVRKIQSLRARVFYLQQQIIPPPPTGSPLVTSINCS